MAQNITIAETDYGDVPAVDFPKVGGGTARFSDTSDADALAEEIFLNKSAYVDGEKVNGSFTIAEEMTAQDGLISQIQAALEGKASGGSVTLEEKTVTPSITKQYVTPSSGFDGLSKVTVEAMPTAEQAVPAISVSTDGLITASATQAAEYVAAGTKSATSQLPAKAAASYTPSESEQTISAGQYLTGAQTIKGDSNLISGNIREGVSIFGVAGSYAGAGGGGVNNVEGYRITSATDVLSFQGSGTLKAWGYGLVKGTYSSTLYSFCGDKYYSGSWGNPTATNLSLSLNADGTLSGLPGTLTSLDLLITMGV